MLERWRRDRTPVCVGARNDEKGAGRERENEEGEEGGEGGVSERAR